MKDADQIIAEIFQIVKEKRSVNYKELYKIKDSDEKAVERAWNILINDYKLISVVGGFFSLTVDGEKHKDVKSYLKSIKEVGLDWYRVIPIILTFLFGIWTAYLGFKNYNQKEAHFAAVQELTSVKKQLSSCESQLKVCGSEIEQSKKQTPKPTSQTKN